MNLQPAPLTRSRRVASSSGTNRELRQALAHWQASVVKLDRVDPVTTEIVRLRCARHHDCAT